jgi:hypothetical protein ELI_0225
MMKKIFLIPIIILALTACGSSRTGIMEDSKKVESHKNEKSKDTKEEGGERIKKKFGSFIIPDGWVEAKEQSGHGKYFYVVKGHENDVRPNNISINKGHQNYNLDESEKFAESTTWQLNMQLKQSGIDAVVYGSSGTTDAGDIMYIFDIKFNDSNEIDRQYYILRDKKFVMIYMSNFDNDESVNETAKLMAKSFEWK